MVLVKISSWGNTTGPGNSFAHSAQESPVPADPSHREHNLAESYWVWEGQPYVSDLPTSLGNQKDIFTAAHNSGSPVAWIGVNFRKKCLHNVPF